MARHCVEHRTQLSADSLASNRYPSALYLKLAPRVARPDVSYHEVAWPLLVIGLISLNTPL